MKPSKCQAEEKNGARKAKEEETIGKKAFEADILHLEQKAAQCSKRRFG